MYITDSASFSDVWSALARQSPERRDVVEARQLIREAAFDPTQLEIVTAAFDGAWRAIESRFENDGEREEARLRLARIILSLASEGMMAPQVLRASAVEAMSEPLD